jgi:hypothetical protein
MPEPHLVRREGAFREFKLRIEVPLNQAAPGYELARVLTELGYQLARDDGRLLSPASGVLRDQLGRKIGNWGWG